MNLRHRISMTLLLALCPGALLGDVYSHLSKVSPEDLARIEAAAPTRPAAPPARSRRLLVYSYAESFHSSVPHGARAIEVLGKSSGAFEVDFTSDTASFEPEVLARYDAVFLNNITPVNKLPKELFLPNCGEGFERLSPAEQAVAQERNERLKRSLMDFVRSGKGLCANHSTTDCFYGWREFGEMIGGYFNGHPWHEKVPIELVDPLSPINRVFGGRNWDIVEEIYQFKETYTREALHVLLRVDPAWEGVRREGLGRQDRDFAVSWIRQWGKGRVFYTALGHREDVYWNPTVLEHFLAGIQFALGDLPADTRPSATLPPAPPVFGEWRIRVKPERVAEYGQLIEKQGLVLFREAGGRPVGWWTTLVGDLYEQVTLWEYDDLAAFERAVRRLGADERFRRFAAERDPLLAGEESRFLRLAPGGLKPALPESAAVVVQEIHRLPPASATKYWKDLEGALSRRRAAGFRLAGPFSTALGDEREITFYWLHGSLAEREALLDNEAPTDAWPRLLAELGVESRTRVLLPAAFFH